MEIETQRLLLREFTFDDWAAVLAYQSDPRYQQYYPLAERTAIEAQNFVHMFLAQQREQPRRKFQLAVTLKSEHKLIGSCGLRLDSAGVSQGDIGFEISPDHWGSGYATEAALVMVKYGFNSHHLHRIWSWCIAENRASARVLEKVGMRLEGRLRENEYFKGRWWDTRMYGMLESEWRARPGSEL